MWYPYKIFSIKGTLLEGLFIDQIKKYQGDAPDWKVEIDALF